MQMHAQATAGQIPGAPTGIPPGLLAGHPAAPPGGIPASLSLLTGIPTSLSTPHPAFASLLAQQKPAVPDPTAVLMARREEELKRESNGGDHSTDSIATQRQRMLAWAVHAREQSDIGLITAVTRKLERFRMLKKNVFLSMCACLI